MFYKEADPGGSDAIVVISIFIDFGTVGWEREAISLTPWLQPGGNLQNDSLNRFQRFSVIFSQQKPLETVPP